ncbi:MAG: hypothetical protein JW749_00815 [Sedimentisphaerales bacterium]|nr:hypothetical protein [Sedimentisphaerales bacterium]
MKGVKMCGKVKICLFLISAFFFALNSELYAESKKSSLEWISDAEKVHTIKNTYTVEVASEITEKGIAIQNLKSVNKQRVLMSYHKEKGIKSKEAGSLTIVLDIQSIFKKTEGKVQWFVESEDTIVDGKSCIVIGGTYEGKKLIRLDIRKTDNAVVRCDQYINGECISSSMLKYSRTDAGDLVPVNILTNFFLTNQTMNQDYIYTNENEPDMDTAGTESSFSEAVKKSAIKYESKAVIQSNATNPIDFNFPIQLPDFNLDSGYIGANESWGKMQLRMYGKINCSPLDWALPGSVWFDGSSMGVTGAANQGRIALDFGLSYGVWARFIIPAIGLNKEIDVLALLGFPSIDFLFQNSKSFTPFLLGSSVTVSDTISKQNVANADVTALIFPGGIPFCGAGVTLSMDAYAEETLTGDNITFSPGGKLYSEAGFITFNGGSSALIYHGNMNLKEIIGYWPGLFAELLAWRAELTPVRFPLTIDSGTFPVVSTPDSVYFAPWSTFGTTDSQKNVKVSLNDCNNNNVTFSITGGGYGKIDSQDCTFSNISLYNTTDTSVLTISPKGKARSSVGNIICKGPIKSINASKISVFGGITIEASSNPKTKTTITIDRAEGLTINSGIPIKTLTATDWIGGAINAPSMERLTIKGDKKRAIAGDLDVNVAVDSNINSVKVAGTLSGEWSCNAVKSITAVDIVEANLILNQLPDSKVKVLALGKLTAKYWIDSIRIRSSGHIGTITAGAIIDSSCFAGTTSTSDIDLDGVLDLPDPSVDIDYIAPTTIKIIKIKGIKGELPPWTINSNIAAANILSASLSYPDNDNDETPFGLSAGFIKSLKIKDAEGTVTYKNLDKPSDSKTFEDAEIRLY